jgi:sugar phosphate isomerase/epimerase
VQNILAGHTNSYHTYTLDQALEGIAKAGFKYVELTAVRGWTEHVPLEATPQDVAEIKAKLAHWGLTPSCLSGHSDLTTTEGVVDGKKAVDLCVQLGLTLMNTAVGGHASADENKDAFLANFFELADYASAVGVDLALEVHGDIMASGQKSIPLIKEIDRDNVGINYDTANCVYYGGVEAVDDIGPVVPYLKHVHLKDTRGGRAVWDFPAVGEGHVDFAGVLKILERGGYTAPFSVEIEFQGMPWPPVDEVHRSMAVSYKTLSGLGLD